MAMRSIVIRSSRKSEASTKPDAIIQPDKRGTAEHFGGLTLHSFL